jgi:hypothetical protein
MGIMKLNLSLFLIIGSVQGFAPQTSTLVHKPITPLSNAVPLATAKPLHTSTQLRALPFLTEESSQKLILLTFEKAIEAGVPALFFVLSAWWIVGLIKGGDDDGACVFCVFACNSYD